MTKTAGDLTITERTELEQYEAVIERGLQTFYEVGQALMEIREKRLYREQYATFEDYSRDRWQLGQSRAYQLIDAAAVISNLQSSTVVELPANERQARPLTSLPPDGQREAWQVAVESAANGRITARHVEAAVEAIKRIEQQEAFDYKRDAKTSRPETPYTPQGQDACQTPAYAIDPLLPYLKPEWTIWEPAQGEGLLVEAFYDSNLIAVGSDLLTGRNFFDYEPPKWDALVTNPPYSLKYPWLERCYELGKPFALLLPVETLGAKTAQDLMQHHGFEMLLLNRRVAFKMPNKGWDSHPQFPVFWLCWQLLPDKVMFGEITNGVDG